METRILNSVTLSLSKGATLHFMPSTTDDKLDAILSYLDRMNRRDRLRTWGGFVRALISLIPMAVFLYGTWYSVTHMDEIIQTITSAAAKQAASFTQGALPGGGALEQWQKLLQK